MTGSTKVVLHFDDDHQYRRRLAEKLAAQGLQWRTPSTYAAEHVLQMAPSVVLTEALLPDSNGTTLCQAIRNQSEVPVIMLTALDCTTHELEALGAGLDAYIRKSDGLSLVAARVASVVRLARRLRGRPVDPNEIRVGPLAIDPNVGRVTVEGRSVKLRPAEVEVLAMLARRPQEVVTRDAFCQALWGARYNPSFRGLDQRIARLRMTLDPLLPGAIRSVRGQGYQLAVDR